MPHWMPYAVAVLRPAAVSRSSSFRERTARSSGWAAVGLLAGLIGCSGSQPAADTGGVARNHPPEVYDVVLTPGTPRPGVPLIASARATDSDGDPLQLEFRWDVDGVPVQAAEGPVFQSFGLARSQAVTVTAQASDGYVLSAPVRSQPAIMANSPPVLGALTVEPELAVAGEPIRCVPAEVVDVDGDAVSFTYRWTATGEPLDGTGDEIVGPTRGQEVRCHATPTDGLDAGEEASSGAATILNTPPTLRGARVLPLDPEAGDELSVQTWGYVDADLDPEGYRYEWYVDGEIKATSARISGVAVRTAQSIYVIISPYDGFDPGEPVTTDAVLVGGGRPGAPRLTGIAADGDIAGRRELACAIGTPSVDPEGDLVTYTFHWSVDGVEHSVEAGVERSVVAPEDQAPGQSWTCEVVPNDGEQDGASAFLELTLSPLADLWAVHDSLRVGQTEIDRPEAISNTVFDGERITVLATRGEVVAFQVIAEAVGAVTIDATLADFEHTELAEITIPVRIPEGDPTLARGRPISLYVQHYLEVTDTTDAPQWIDPLTPSRGSPGAWPGPLVPEHATLGGLPSTIEAGHNQGLWVDVYVSPTREPGIYDSELVVDADGIQTTIPIVLSVAGYVLPDDNRVVVAALFDPAEVEARHGADLTDAYHRMAHQHRIELITPADADALVDQSRRLDGTLYSVAEAYGGPGLDQPDRLAARAWGALPTGWEDVGAAALDASAWMAVLEGIAADPLALVWPFDRPGPEVEPDVVALGGAIDAADDPGPDLSMLVGGSPIPGAAPVVDGWVVDPSRWREEVRVAEIAVGRTYWYRDGQRPWTGALLLDTPALDTRMHGAMLFVTEAEVFPLWHANHWTDGAPLDVWSDPVTWTDGESIANGAGVLIWPGEDALFPEQDRGIPGPIGSIRLAMLRRAVQDHRILVAASEAGLIDEVEDAMGALLPNVLGRLTADDPVGHLEVPATWERHRVLLLEALDTL